MKKTFYLLLIGVACAPTRKNPLSNSFHNMTAHYNAYFIAKERINEIEQSIFDAQEWNYNKILPIHPQFDSSQSAGMKDLIGDCIQKSSIAIQRHPGSKWEDDSYILVGKARYYAREFVDAVETFKYINTKSENDVSRHEALVELMRTFTDFNEYNNALAVSDYLHREKLTPHNRRLYHLNAAYLHQKREDFDKMVFHLVKAEELYVKSRERSRINFIIGQTYHSLGFESEAFRHYQNVLKNNPSYELEFYSKLYMAQVTELSKNTDIKKIRKYFRSLLKDPKNDEYMDKIYYELAGFELKNNNLEQAIENYKQSVQSSKGNERQKGYAYLKLGEIYYDSLKMFAIAKSYYDSTVATLPKDEENFELIKTRQEVLSDFVKYIDVIVKNDSLLNLSTLSEDSLQALATLKIETERKEQEKRIAKEKKARKWKANNTELISTVSSNSVWYFANVNAISKGRNEFLQKWGERVLEDNWRRSNKSASPAEISLETPPLNTTPQVFPEADEETGISTEVAQLISKIPTNQEQKDQLLTEIEEAYYQLGNIYHLRLKENQNAVESFETMLSRFPQTSYEAEILYQLFLIYKEINPAKSTDNGNLLKQKYPKSIFAKLLENPNYREESFAISENLKALYRKLYKQYEAGLLSEVIYRSDSVLKIHTKNEFSDNIKLLQILAIGQQDGNRKYQYEIGNFIKQYSESELIPYANTLLETSREFQQNRYNSAKARFISDFQQKHFFVLVYDIKGNIGSKLSTLIETFLSEKNFTTLKTGNLILHKDKSMLLISEFPGKATAISFSTLFEESISLSNMFKGEKIDFFVITENNFDILYKTKDVSAYLNFFEKYYL